MKINEVEALVGITKKNIRFYEEQGLLTPKRNTENGYREYTEQEINTLSRIKLFRKLGVSIEEIRNAINGVYTVADIMQRHMVVLDREKQNVQQSMLLCQQIKGLDIPISKLDAYVILKQMESLELEGTTFKNKQERDVRVKYIAPIIIAIAVVILMIGLCFFMIWAYHISPNEAPPIWFLWLVISIFAAIGVGVVLALIQRLREIEKGEIEDAKRY